MDNWKIALVAGSLGAGVVLLVRGKRGAGLVAAGVGAVVLASEYPDKVEEVRRRIPEYADRAVRIIENLAEAGDRFAQLLEKRGQDLVGEISSYRD
jgi:hypothetical protein